MRLGPLLVLIVLWATTAPAQETVRIALFNVGLSQNGPGLLLKKIQKQDPPVLALAQIIAQVDPDILLIAGFDNDYRNIAISAFRDVVAEHGATYPFIFAEAGNAGVPSGLDLNGNGRLGDWADNWGFGRFEGNKSMALLSRYPVNNAEVRRFNRLMWHHPNGSMVRLSSRGHFDVPLYLPDGNVLHILASYPTPPVFDGPDDVNGLRNDAEIRFWVDYLNGETLMDDAGFNEPFDATLFAIVSDLNADPMDGDGIGKALADLFSHPLLVDPLPESAGAVEAAGLQGGLNDTQLNDPRYDTADWDDKSTGNLRVDYVLPSASLEVSDSGIFWPLTNDPNADLIERAETAHRLVWVDVIIP